MRAVAGPGPGSPANPGSRRGSGRWVWGLSGLVTAAALGIPLAHLITGVGDPQGALPQNVVTRTETVPQPVTSVVVDSYGGQVQVVSGPVSRVQVTETIMYDQQAGLPAVVQSVSAGRLALSSRACASTGCSVDFRMTVPPGVTATVSTGGGQVTVSGTAGANLDSGGGPATATLIGGPLTVVTDGGNLLARDIAAATATIVTGGGDATVAFSAAPKSVKLSTDGGTAVLAVPGGPYAVTADSGGGQESLAIATDPAARPTLTVSSGGGALRIEPAPRLWRPGLSA
jgi:hypothetical protein